MKRGKCDGVVGHGMIRGPLQGLGLAEGRRGLCRAQPVVGRRRPRSFVSNWPKANGRGLVRGHSRPAKSKTNGRGHGRRDKWASPPLAAVALDRTLPDGPYPLPP